MRIAEIVNAESIVGLWKVISDTTWATIDQQVQAQANEKRERAAKARSRKGGSAKKSGSHSSPKAKPPTPVPTPVPAPVPKSNTVNKAQPKTVDAVQQAPTAAGYPAPQTKPVPRPGSQGVSSLPPSAVAVPGQTANPDEQEPKLKAIAGGMTTR